jgi:hypothetical protein
MIKLARKPWPAIEYLKTELIIEEREIRRLPAAAARRKRGEAEERRG